MKHYLIAALLMCSGAGFFGLQAQTLNPSSNYLVAHPIPDKTLFYNLTDTGVYTPIRWGLDTAWPSEENMRRGIAFMGTENIHLVRASFQPTLPLVNGDLQSQQITDLNRRLSLIDLTGSETRVALNCDHPSVDAWYSGNAANWAQLMDVTTRRVQERGRTVVSIAPFNEPDYGWGQGSMTDFFNIAGELKNNPRFDSIRISGGNTLNTDQALSWYNALKSRLDEGNTHQLAGSFDNYANFFKTVRTNGHHATNDELHNVMEAMVGVEYGMQTGIWWGTAELARGEFVKASFGKRLGYAEHRANWTAASVYRHPEGKVQAFVGSSERQAVTTNFLFVSQDRDVYYDGHGPQRSFSLEMPGGNGYQQGQTNAERVINISWGDDIQPAINGSYVVVNRNSSKVIEVASGSTAAGINVRQNTSAGAAYQQWNVIPVDSRIVGDFSYYTLTAVHSGKSMDVYNWSLNSGANIIVWDDAKGANQQWFLEYAEDGWFYIRSRHSALCLEVANASVADAANIQQGRKDGSAKQQWRFLPVDAPVEFSPPTAPVNLLATATSASVRLDWSAATDADLAGYKVYRADSTDSAFQTIARNLTTNFFVDHSVFAGKHYTYAVRAVDKSLNHSEYSNLVTATSTGVEDLVALYCFEDNILDSSIHLNHAASYAEASFVEGRIGSGALELDGNNDFVLLPATLANHKEITVATWIYWNGGLNGQRIFDFAYNNSSYMYLTPKTFPGEMRFTIRNGGSEQQLKAGALPTGQWCHVAITLSDSLACLYLNGEALAQSTTFSISPADFRPVLNYLGRGHFVTTLFNGSLDDFRVYNHALNPEQVALLAQGSVNDLNNHLSQKDRLLTVWPQPANELIYVHYPVQDKENFPTLRMYSINGRLIMSKNITDPERTELDVTQLIPGLYLLKLSHDRETLVRKIYIKR